MVVGSIELLPVPDAVGLLADYGEAYPDVPAEAWEPYRALYPELFPARVGACRATASSSARAG